MLIYKRKKQTDSRKGYFVGKIKGAIPMYTSNTATSAARCADGALVETV